MLIKKICILFVAFYLSAIPNLLAQNANDTPFRDKMSLVFSPDMIGATIAYLEYHVGPAKRKTNFQVNGEPEVLREYQIGPCKVFVSGNEDIKHLELRNINEDCTFNILPFLGEQGEKDAHETTFGFLAENANSYRFTTECMKWCGSASDVAIEFQFTIFRPGVGESKMVARRGLYPSNDQIDKLSSQLTDFLVEKEGEEWVTLSRYANDEKYAQIALKYFTNIRISEFKYY
ncbi:MAG: hypothetical protein LBF58_07050 [Deltaproteobacteria bacterium]|jgi:hypothetical protein|nr:hypothetical protein [Deltaproteobacteria bacterium]